MKEAAILVGAGLSAQKGGAIFCRAKLSSQYTVAVDRAIDSLYAQGCIFSSGIGYVDAHALIWSTRFCLADNNLVNFAILAKILGTPQSLQQGVFLFDLRHKTYHVDQVLLLDPNAGKVPPVGGFDLLLLCLFSLGRGLLSVLVGLIGFEFFGGGDLVLYRLLVVRPPTVWAGALFVGILEAVEAELADLCGSQHFPQSKASSGRCARSGRGAQVYGVQTYLVATWTRFEILVREVELLDAERTEKDCQS